MTSYPYKRTVEVLVSHNFPKFISPNVNFIALLEFELANNGIIIEHVNHSNT